ncbi:hypothetical protein EC973_007054, partial [Apophysomyces ossiformis]
CAYLHIDTHANASVFFNRYKGAAISLGAFDVQVRPARYKSGATVVYSQQELSFLQSPPPTPTPRLVSVSVPSSSVSVPTPPLPPSTSDPAPVSVPSSSVSVPTPPLPPSTSDPAPVSVPSSSQCNVATPSWKRKQEECYLLLQQDIKSKRAKLHQLKKELEKMEEQEAMMKKILDL